MQPMKSIFYLFLLSFPQTINRNILEYVFFIGMLLLVSGILEYVGNVGLFIYLFSEIWRHNKNFAVFLSTTFPWRDYFSIWVLRHELTYRMGISILRRNNIYTCLDVSTLYEDSDAIIINSIGIRSRKNKFVTYIQWEKVNKTSDTPQGYIIIYVVGHQWKLVSRFGQMTIVELSAITLMIIEIYMYTKVNKILMGTL